MFPKLHEYDFRTLCPMLECYPETMKGCYAQPLYSREVSGPRWNL